MILMVLLAHAGMWQDLTEAAVWSRHWHLNALSLTGCLLALKGRPGFAVTGVVAAAVTVVVLGTRWPSPNNDITGTQILFSCIIVAAAVLVNLGVRYFVGRLPAARRHLREAQRAAAAAVEIEERRRVNLARLEGEILPVFDAIAGSGTIDPGLRERAHLTDLRLRDAIRSPLLDSPDLRAAVWEARQRGLTVLLLDDRSESTGTPHTYFLHDTDRIPRPLTEEIVRTLQTTVGGTVTIRLTPPTT